MLRGGNVFTRVCHYVHRAGVRARREVCVHELGMCVCGGGEHACMGGLHDGGGMCGEGVCMVKGGMHGEKGRVCIGEECKWECFLVSLLIHINIDMI